MKNVIYSMLGAGLLCLSSCGGQAQKEQAPAPDESSAKNQVIETIMTRRSVRKYLPQPVNRDTMQMILDCGIHAPMGRINSHGRYAWWTIRSLSMVLRKCIRK